MSASILMQLLSIASNVFLGVVFGVGYWFLYRISRRTLEEMRESRIVEGRPLIIVYNDYSRSPEVDLIIRNIGGGPAKNICFETSAPITCSDGAVISEMRYLKEGMESLAPDAQVSCYWDDLGTLIPHLKEQDLENGIEITTRYEDLLGNHYETSWNINPALYEGNRDVTSRDMPALVDTLAGLRSDINAAMERTNPVVQQKDVGDGASER